MYCFSEDTFQTTPAVQNWDNMSPNYNGTKSHPILQPSEHKWCSWFALQSIKIPKDKPGERTPQPARSVSLTSTSTSGQSPDLLSQPNYKQTERQIHSLLERYHQKSKQNGLLFSPEPTVHGGRIPEHRIRAKTQTDSDQIQTERTWSGSRNRPPQTDLDAQRGQTLLALLTGRSRDRATLSAPLGKIKHGFFCPLY